MPRHKMDPTYAGAMAQMAGKREVVKELAEEFLCPVCREQFDQKNRRPKVLPCNHVFCLECINQCVAFGWMLDFTLKCPLCRQVEKFESSTSITNLPEPLLLKQLQEKISSFLSEHASDGSPCNRVCGLCEGPPYSPSAASSFCLTCARNLCRSCAGKHKQNFFFKSHQLVRISRATSCDAHPAELVIAYCRTCGKGVCMLCGNSETHAQHDIIDISDSDLVKEKKQYLTEYKERSSLFHHQMVKHVDEITDLSKKMITTDIQFEGWLDDFHTTIFNLTIQYHQKIKQKLQKEEKKLQTHLNDLDDMETTRQSLILTVDELLAENSSTEIVLSAGKLPDVSSKTVPYLPALALPCGKDKRIFLHRVRKLLDEEDAKAKEEDREMTELQLRIKQKNHEKHERAKGKATNAGGNKNVGGKDHNSTAKDSRTQEKSEPKPIQDEDKTPKKQIPSRTTDGVGTKSLSEDPLKSISNFAEGTFKGLLSFMGGGKAKDSRTTGQTAELNKAEQISKPRAMDKEKVTSEKPTTSESKFDVREQTGSTNAATEHNTSPEREASHDTNIPKSLEQDKESAPFRKALTVEEELSLNVILPEASLENKAEITHKEEIADKEITTQEESAINSSTTGITIDLKESDAMPCDVITKNEDKEAEALEKKDD